MKQSTLAAAVSAALLGASVFVGSGLSYIDVVINAKTPGGGNK
jgi:cobalt transporter subunit CbtB